MKLEYILVPKRDRVAHGLDAFPGQAPSVFSYCPICNKPRWLTVNVSVDGVCINYVPIDEYGRYAPRFSTCGLLPASDLRIEVGLSPGKEGPSNIADLRADGVSVREDAFGFRPVDCCKCPTEQ